MSLTTIQTRPLRSARRCLASVSLAVCLVSAAVLAVGLQGASAAVSPGWELTIYWTPVEAFFGTGQPVVVPNCDVLAPDLGTHDSNFLAAVAVQGMGRAAGPVDALGDSYLAWNGSCGTAFSLPVDASGNALHGLNDPNPPYVTMAGDWSVIPAGTAVTITDCGTDGGTVIDATVCNQLKSASWRVTDTGVTGFHLDMYIGEQDRTDMTTSPYFHDLTGATITI